MSEHLIHLGMKLIKFRETIQELSVKIWKEKLVFSQHENKINCVALVCMEYLSQMLSELKIKYKIKQECAISSNPREM